MSGLCGCRLLVVMRALAVEHCQHRAYARRSCCNTVCMHILPDEQDAVTYQVRSLEETFKFGSFFSPMLTESDFDAKPSVLLLGQYSTGATNCIARICHRNPSRS